MKVDWLVAFLAVIEVVFIEEQAACALLTLLLLSWMISCLQAALNTAPRLLSAFILILAFVILRVNKELKGGLVFRINDFAFLLVPLCICLG